MKSAGARDGISKSQGSLENGLVIWLSGVRWGGYGILQCSVLGGDDAYIKFHYVDVSPYPFNILGTVKIKADVETKTQIGNSVSLSVNIRKSNLNGGFTWEVGNAIKG